MRQEKWVLIRKGADFKGIANKFFIDPLTARLIINRGINTEEKIRQYLSGGKNDMYDPFLLEDMDKAVDILSKKIAGDAKIRVIGDYDIDGVMGSVILYLGLSRIGAKVDADIPDRFIDGYGLSDRLVDKAAKDGIDTIVTVDNGIASHNQISRAKECGMTVIVTDHHEIASIPDADAVVDPKREENEYPYREMCGATVGFKLILALYKKMGIDMETADDLIQYAAIATVGDIVELQDENRIIVKEGFRILKETENIGLKALSYAAGANLKNINSYMIGFVIGPCINASGRINTALEAFRLLISDNEAEAVKIANDLKKYNDERKMFTDDGLEKAVEIIEKDRLYENKVLIVNIPDCHESVVGIIASRIRELYYRPVYVLTKSDDILKGSGRSIEEYDLFAETSKCRELLEKFGGHAMAAGLSIKESNFDEFVRRMNENCELSEEELIEKVRIDIDAPFEYMTEKFINELDRLEPFGKGNNKPLFARKNVVFENPRLIGAKKKVFKAVVRLSGGQVIDAICFNDGDELLNMIKSGKPVSVVYYPAINEYCGVRNIQIVIKHFG